MGMMLRKLLLIGTLIAQLCFGAAAQAQQGNTEMADRAANPVTADDVEAWLDGFLPYALAKGRVAGAVVVVVDRDGPILSKGYGFADVAKRTPVSPDGTLFRPGSVSKLFTWTAVMQEVEAGRLDLDADVNQYLDFTIPPFEGKPITLRHIMTHTAGFEESLRYLLTNNGDAMIPLGTLMKRSLPQRVFEPGTTPAYSNYATALAGYMVERVSGSKLEDYIEQRIFSPLGMTRSSFRQPLPPALLSMMSNGYKESTGEAQPFEFVLPWPAGSLSATGTDMGRFMIAHLNQGRGMLEPETARLMQDYRAPGILGLNRMALGFYEQTINGHRAIGHGGDTTLFHSNLVLFPEAGLGIYISMNSSGSGGATSAIRSALVQGFAKRYLTDAAPATVALDEAESRARAAEIAGNYVVSRGSKTNFLSLLGLIGQGSVYVDEEGRLQFPALDLISASPRDWVEVAPYIWEDRNTGEKLAAQVTDGEVIQLSVEPVSPFMVYKPAPFGTNAVWLLPALLGALALIALAAIFWPIRAGVRWYYGAEFALKGSSLTAWRLSRLAAWLVLAGAAGWLGLITAFSLDISSIGGPLDWLIQLLRVLSPLAALLLVISAGWHFWLSFRFKRRWTMKLGAFLLTLSGLVCLWVVWSFNLYGFGLVY